MTKIDAKIVNKIKELYELGGTIEQIAERLDLDRGTVSYYAGMNGNSPPKRYIKDPIKREAEIKRLEEKKGKEYKEILYLKYLRGNISKDLYESGFNN